MRKLQLVTLLLFLASLTYAQKTRNLSSFTTVSAQEGIDVFMEKGSSETARIEASGIDDEDVLTDVSGGHLKIHLDGDNHRNVNVKVYVTYKELEGLKASSAASIDVKDKVITSNDFDIACSSAGDIRVSVSARNIDIDVSSSGDVNVEVEAESLEIEVSSAGDVDIAGKVKDSEIKASSSGDVDGYDLVCDKAELRASSGASIKVTVNEELEARASSGADIRYKGSPKQTDNESSSGGSVKRS